MSHYKAKKRFFTITTVIVFGAVLVRKRKTKKLNENVGFEIDGEVFPWSKPE